MKSVEELIKHHEGLKLKPYRCSAGRITIGYGHNLEDNGLTKKQAEGLLRDDIDVAIREIYIKVDNFTDLDQVRQAVLIDMYFNLGSYRFCQFVRMISAVESFNFDRAADEMINSTWYHQVGQRSKRLVLMMITGHWPKAV